MGSRYLVRRLVQAFATIVFILIVNFFLFRMLPGDPVDILTRNPRITEASREALKERWGLNKPLFPDQLVAYVGATVQGDLGYSVKFRGQPVTEVVGDRIWPTVLLLGVGQFFAILIGLALGAVAGWKRGTPADYGGTALSLILYSMPYFWLGMILLIIFATSLGWFPGFGFETPGGRSGDPVAKALDIGGHLALPAFTVAIGLVGQYSLLMRSSLIDVLAEDYITTARAKGLRGGRILRAHALPNALLPTVTLVAINLGYVIAGAITVEQVFSWPGLGTLTVEAIRSRDYPIMQAVFLLLSISVVIANLVADLIYGLLDPRVKV